jgi:lysyl-tRNA synthetase class 2
VARGKTVDETTQDLLSSFEKEHVARVHAVAGRIMSLRKHGTSIFAHLQDRSGKIQIYLKQDVLGDAAFDQFENVIDIGDILWVQGTLFKTKTGEITLKVDAYELLSKCLHPLPEKFHGLADIETRYRKRYLDILTNEQSKQRFYDRAMVVRTIRTFLDSHGFIEVETPILHPIPGGAIARPFVTHHNALGADFYLRIAPELYLKRLVMVDLNGCMK